jgi:hypothetical protein
MTHSYADGTVDGELAIAVPRGESEQELFREMLRGFGQKAGDTSAGFWIQVGLRYVIREDDVVYRRYRGMNELGTYYAHMDRSGIIAATFGTARDLMSPGARDKYRRKANMVFVRMHWNPYKAQPER